MEVKRQFSTDLMRKPYLDTGVSIVCPHCRAFIAKTIRPIRFGEPLKSSHFQGPGIRFGAEMKCDRCGMPWYLKATGQLHTAHGWFPEPEWVK